MGDSIQMGRRRGTDKSSMTADRTEKEDREEEVRWKRTAQVRKEGGRHVAAACWDRCPRQERSLWKAPPFPPGSVTFDPLRPCTRVKADLDDSFVEALINGRVYFCPDTFLLLPFERTFLEFRRPIQRKGRLCDS